MSRLLTGSLPLLILTAGVCPSQIIQPPARPPHYIEIKLPSEARSEGVFIRYILAGEDLGGWIQPNAGVSSHIISTMHGERPATGIKAVLYAPGCAIQTLDVPLSSSENAEYTFACRPLQSVRIPGRLIQSERLHGHEVKLRAKYIARWAQGFLGLGANVALSIPVGDVAHLDADGRFQISVPDLSVDPMAGAADHPGELQIWAQDENSDDNVAQLIPTGPQASRTRLGGLKLQSAYPLETVFAPCGVNPSRVFIDREGFSRRQPGGDPCDR